LKENLHYSKGGRLPGPEELQVFGTSFSAGQMCGIGASTLKKRT